MKMFKFVTDKKAKIYVVTGAKNKYEALKYIAQCRKIGMLTMQFDYKDRKCVVRKHNDMNELYWDAKGLEGPYENGYAFIKSTLSWP